jgi:hypothetical protein
MTLDLRFRTTRNWHMALPIHLFESHSTCLETILLHYILLQLKNIKLIIQLTLFGLKFSTNLI